MGETFRRYLPSFVGILIALWAAILLMQALRPVLTPLEADLRVLLQLGVKWIITLILLGIVLLWERERLSSIGIRRMNRQDVLWAFVGFLIAGALISGTIPLLKALGIGTTEAGVRRLGEFSFALRILIVLTAAITEEIQYRGYPIERLYKLTGSLPLSALITYIVFVGLHISFWTIGGAIQIGLGSLVLYAIYLWRRNLPACMLMHFLNNSVAFLLIPEFLKHVPTQSQ
jgi:membrane protease YdiL (CAAX protease family)